MITSSGEVEATSPSPSRMTRLVYGISAVMSLLTKTSPSPRPMTSGALSRAPTIRPGSSAEITTSAYAPWMRCSAARTAAARSPR